QLGHTGLPASLFQAPLPLSADLQAQFFEGTADFDRAAIPEQFFDLPQNDRHGIGGKADAASRIEPVAGLDQPQTSGGIQFLIFDAAALEPSGAGVDQPQVFFNEFGARQRFDALCGHGGIPPYIV